MFKMANNEFKWGSMKMTLTVDESRTLYSLLAGGDERPFLDIIADFTSKIPRTRQFIACYSLAILLEVIQSLSMFSPHRFLLWFVLIYTCLRPSLGPCFICKSCFFFVFVYMACRFVMFFVLGLGFSLFARLSSSVRDLKSGISSFVPFLKIYDSNLQLLDSPHQPWKPTMDVLPKSMRLWLLKLLYIYIYIHIHIYIGSVSRPKKRRQNISPISIR